MNTIARPDVESVLAQMRSLQQLAAGREAAQAMELDAAQSIESAQPAGKTGFGELLKSAVDSVSETQAQAGALGNAFLRGETQDLVRVMVQIQKANVGFQAMVQVRNRMVSAYQDIMNMPL